MFYSLDYIIKKIEDNLQGAEIFVRESKEGNTYIVSYEGKKAKLNLDSFLARLGEKRSEDSDKLLEDFVYNLTKNLRLQASFDKGNFDKVYVLDNIYPVLRATSFAKDSKENFFTENHTSESKIFYSLDLGDSYRLLTEEFLTLQDISKEEAKERAMKNLEKLPLNYNTDEVAGNTFYFLNSKDGYDASRLLVDKVLKYFYEKIGGDFYIGLPHQDTLIIADIKNKQGLEIMQKMMVHFFTEGRVPITTITFKYDNKNLETLFIYVE